MKKSLSLLSLCLVPGLLATEPSLEDLLAEATKIATKTKLNIDYVPGTVSVIRGEELASMGITNLSQHDALDMIIGMEFSVGSLRGVGPWYGSNGSKIKWMINDTPIEMEMRSTDDWAKGPTMIPIPTAMIDRIEVIRGPGSAIYGGNAIFGVVNIVTKKEGSGLTGGVSYLGGNNYAKDAGAYTTFHKGEFSGTLSVAKSVSDGYDVNVGSQGHFYADIWNGHQLPGYGPGKLPLSSLTTTAMGDFSYGKSRAWVYRYEVQLGQGYDWIPTDALPADQGQIAKKSTTTMVGIETPIEIGSVTVTPKIGWSEYNNPASYMKWTASDANALLTSIFGAGNFTPLTQDAYRYRSYKEQKGFVQLDALKEMDQHTLLGGVLLQRTQILEDDVQTNYDSSQGNKWWYLWHGRGSYNGIFDRRPIRIQKALYIQDEWDVTDQLTVTAGARWDSFSDIEQSAVSPRLAAVYRYHDNHILKSQISRAFRAPSLYENYGYMSPMANGNFSMRLKPETVDTFEMAYIYKRLKGSVKATYFHSVINNLITQEQVSYIYMNNPGESKIDGLEVEGAYQTGGTTYGMNVGLYATTYKTAITAGIPGTSVTSTSDSFALAPQAMGNVYMTLNTDTLYPTTFWYRYVGPKPRRSGETYVNGTLIYQDNGSIQPQHIVNITQQIKSADRNMVISFGVRNLLDQEQTLLYAPLSGERIDMPSLPGYNYQDIPYARRSLWANLSYKF